MSIVRHETSDFLPLRDRRGAICCSGSPVDLIEFGFECDVFLRFRDGGRFCSSGKVVVEITTSRRDTAGSEGTASCPNG